MSYLRGSLNKKSAYDRLILARYMCICGLVDDTHWFVDSKNAPHMWQIAQSPEQAEHNLRSWAGAILRSTQVQAHLGMKPVAARILKIKVLFMRKLCESNIDIHPGVFE
jgi:hypothetical protein